MCSLMSMICKEDTYDKPVLGHEYLSFTSLKLVLFPERLSSAYDEEQTDLTFLQSEAATTIQRALHDSFRLPNITEGGTSLAFSGLCHGSDSASWSALFRLREEQAGKCSLCNTAAICSTNSFHFVGPRLRSNEF